MSERINPELIRVAAEMAEPQYQWVIDDPIGGNPMVHRYGSPYLIFFNPLNDGKDANSLMLALMKEGWFIFHVESGKFVARHPIHCSTSPTSNIAIQDESFPLLLLKCVSAMRGINLYV